jgi:thiosulfate/3-mercaptopyruvate sulfurtransferase
MTNPTPLVSTAWLQEKLDTDDSIVVLEVSSRRALPETSTDRHVPGARFVFWKDLCWHDSDRQFPSPEQMAGRLSALGVADDTTIAVVGDPFQYGTYAYWALTMAGQESRTVLVDGGRETWLAEERYLGGAATDVAEGHLTPGELDESSRMGRSQVRDRLNDPDVCLLDVRSPEEYSGERVSPSWFEVDYGAERHGRIPGAVHLYYADLLRNDGTFLDRDALQARFERVTADTTEIVSYCRLSHRATLAWFALTRILDHPAVRIYDGSWTEWGTIVGFPVER